jgi:hypothetical protein
MPPLVVARCVPSSGARTKHKLREETHMRKKGLVSMLMFWWCAGGAHLAAQDPAAVRAPESDRPSLSASTNKDTTDADAQAGPTGGKLAEVIDRIVKREHEEMAAFDLYSPIIETYIQEVKPDKQLGLVPKSDVYLLGQADFRGRIKVHSMTQNEKKGSLLWSFVPAGFLQMIFVDRGGFDKTHYRFEYKGREFLGEVRCIVFEVSAAPKARGPRFIGAIWVEDQDYTIVRINGTYSHSNHFSLKTLQDEYYLHFDSWRTNVKSGLWMPSYVYSQELARPTPFGNPNYKSATHLWGYKLKSSSREEELNRLLVESANPVKEEAAQHDRSPLEAEREWRHEAENNVLDLLEHDGLLAPQGEVDKVLNAIVNNLEVTNNLDGQIDLHCRVLLTSNLEMFSIGSTVVLSRGLLDVVPDEATLAAMLAHEIADAMLPKPYQDQYALNDLVRLSPTEVLRRLSFREEKTDTAANGEKAMELLKKSPYASNLTNAGLFLRQLQSQSKELKRLISPQLGNQAFFASQLLQSAPALEPGNKDQIAALPLGSRVKIDPWNAGVSLMKTKPFTRLSVRDKMPFEVTPLLPYLTRYAEPPAAQDNSKVPAGRGQ